MGILKLLAGLADWANQYTGVTSELTSDESNWNLRLHDGATPGGRIILNRDNSDARYQGKSAELNGFAFPPEGKGFLVRTSPGVYALRSFAGSVNISVTYPLGTDGNPVIELDPVIEGTHTFVHRVSFTTGIESDVQGNTFGTHTGPVTGNVTGNLQGNSEGNHLGGLDARGSELYFDPGQIPYEAIGDVPAAAAGFPARAIVIWSGLVAEIPAGWFLCNGANGTPDLRDRFILGAGGAYNVGATGGTESHSHVGGLSNEGAHAHIVAVEGHALTLDQMPSHEHLNGVVDNVATLFNHGAVGANPAPGGSIESNGDNAVYEGRTTKTGGLNGVTQPHGHGATSAEAGLHTHDLGIEATNHLPPYYALCYIMKGI